jgi:hypothetical protein
MTDSRTQLDSIQWRGDNRADVEAFVGAPCDVTDGVLHVAIGGGASLALPPRGWLVRVEGSLRTIEPRVDHNDQHAARQFREHFSEVVDNLAADGGFD